MSEQHPSPPTSPTVDAILERENFTLEEILGGDDVLKKCRDLNNRLINFLCGKDQVEQMLRYTIEEPPVNSDLRRIYMYPCISFEILTIGVEAILTTMVGEEQLMDLLFSFLDPNRSHRFILANQFSKVVLCLVHRKALFFMIYVQDHLDVFGKLVDLIGVLPIMEFLVHLLGSDKYYPDRLVMMQWLAESNLLEMIVDKLDRRNAPAIHSSAAEILCAVAGNFTSPMALKLSSPRFIETLFGHALRDSASKSSLVHSLTICIPLLEPKLATTYSPSLKNFQGSHTSGGPNPAIRDIIHVMLPKLGDLRRLLDTSGDEENLPPTYGELKPPLGRHRLKIVEFLAVLMTVGDDAVERELVSSGNIHRVVDLFFEYPFSNFLHHHVEVIISLCLHSNNLAVVEHMLRDCNLIGKILGAASNLDRADDVDQVEPTVFSAGKRPPRAGNVGHVTSIANLLVRLGRIYGHVQAHLQEHREWNEWQARVLQPRNAVENVFGWACGRPVVGRGDADRGRHASDEDEEDDDEEEEEAIAPGVNPRKRRCGPLTIADCFSYEGDQNREAAPDPPSNSMEDVHFYRTNNNGETSSTPMKYSRRLMLRFAAEKGETSSQTTEASSTTTRRPGHDNSTPSNDELETEVSRPGSNQFEFDDDDADWSGALPK